MSRKGRVWEIRIFRFSAFMSCSDQISRNTVIGRNTQFMLIKNGPLSGDECPQLIFFCCDCCGKDWRHSSSYLDDQNRGSQYSCNSSKQKGCKNPPARIESVNLAELFCVLGWPRGRNSCKIAVQWAGGDASPDRAKEHACHTTLVYTRQDGQVITMASIN